LLLAASAAHADRLTRWVEDSLDKLGYDTGEVDGTATTQTTIAISQFQAENGLEITGKVSPQLAGILAAEVEESEKSASSAPATEPNPVPTTAVTSSKPVPAARVAAAADPAELRRLTRADFAGVPRHAFTNGQATLIQAQHDGTIAACDGARNPVIRQNVSLVTEHVQASSSNSPTVRQAMAG
jgi:peptidoglycan hydrolase-like protein with peptidoglycan-binding domain